MFRFLLRQWARLTASRRKHVEDAGQFSRYDPNGTAAHEPNRGSFGSDGEVTRFIAGPLPASALDPDGRPTRRIAWPARDQPEAAHPGAPRDRPVSAGEPQTDEDVTRILPRHVPPKPVGDEPTILVTRPKRPLQNPD